MPVDRPDVSAILVSFNTRDMTLRCLVALEEELRSHEAEIWLVDNASEDGTADAVRQRCPNVRLIENTENLGFGAANNQAMREARGRYFLLLNTDAFVEPDAVRRLLDFMEQHKEVAAAGPRLLNQDGSRQESLHRLDTPGNVWFHYLGLARLLYGKERPSCPPPVLQRWKYYLKGACLLVRRDVYEAIGGFDERFFFYGDEADWEKRMVAAGHRLAYVDEARVTHLMGKSGVGQRLRYTLHYYAARDLYMAKHFGPFGLVAYRAAVLLWCLRKLAQQAWWRARPGKPSNPFAAQVHGFILRNLLRSPAQLPRAADRYIASPAGASACSGTGRRATANT